MLGARPTAEDPDGSAHMRPNPHSKGYAGWALSWRWWRSLRAERPSHRPRRWLGPWPLAVPTRASPQCLTRTHAPQSGCMTVLGYRCTAFNWGAISRPQASYTGLHPTDARSKSEYSLTHSLTHLKEPVHVQKTQFHHIISRAYRPSGSYTDLVTLGSTEG